MPLLPYSPRVNALAARLRFVCCFSFMDLLSVSIFFFFFFNDPPTPEISPLPLHDPFPILAAPGHPHSRLWVTTLVVSGARLQRHVGERTVLVVAVQNIGGHVTSHVDVRPAVVVDIHCGDTEAVMTLGVSDAGFL